MSHMLATYYSRRPMQLLKDATALTTIYGTFPMKLESSDGVPIYNINKIEKLATGEVYRCIDEALRLIRLNDAYRSGILAKYVRTIVNRYDIASARVSVTRSTSGGFAVES